MARSTVAPAAANQSRRYFVSLLDPAGRELINVTLKSADDGRVVAWGRRMIAERVCAAVRIERSGGLLLRGR